MKRKIIIFSIVAALPALFLIGTVSIILLDIHEIRSLDYDKIYRGLKDHLSSTQPVSFPLPDEIYELNGSKKTVFIFGESSVVLSDKGTFHDYLEQFHDNLQVVNFGVSGIDSFSVSQRVKEALSIARPDVIILYYGHNDYNNAYHGYLLPKYFQKFDSLLRIPYFFYDKNNPVSVFSSGDFYWFSRLHRPKLFYVFERLGLIDIDDRDFDRINQLILDHFIENNHAIMDMAASNGIPVVLITPVSNLSVEPYGDIDITTMLYRKGQGLEDYSQSVLHLKKARDSEIFTYDLRAKSPLVDYIRNFSHPNVFILDLERELEKDKFAFGNSEFLDYFHFNDKSHKLIADKIYDFMERNNLTGNAPAKK